MRTKKTQLLAIELRMIADTLASNHCRKILKEAANRLEDTEKIAEFYRKLAEKGAKKSGRRKMDKNNDRHLR